MSNTFKSEIAPKGMKFDVNEFMISDKYATILTIISYPKIIGPGFLANVTNLPGVKVVIKHIPIDFSTMSRMINKEIADLKERYQHENERTLQERIRQDYESLESFVQMLAATQSKIFDFQMHIMLTADTKEELENKKQIILIDSAIGKREDIGNTYVNRGGMEIGKAFNQSIYFPANINIKTIIGAKEYMPNYSVNQIENLANEVASKIIKIVFELPV